jgi:CubicO group peptidase (beta-lactamase class C family)
MEDWSGTGGAISASVITGEQIRSLAGHGVPGVAVLVAGPEGVRAAGAAGLADVAGQVPASPGMVCPWFSMTKIVTATAAVRPAERGMLDLDALAFGLVPALRQVQPAGWARRITARHLLSHSAGLANPIPVRWVHPAGTPAPDPDGFLGGLLARHGKLRFEPGTRSSTPTWARWCWQRRWPPQQASRSPPWSQSRSSARWG